MCMFGMLSAGHGAVQHSAVASQEGCGAGALGTGLPGNRQAGAAVMVSCAPVSQWSIMHPAP